jgi:two-component sensor histidine kinase/CheY-like chemotaxis protein
MTTPLHILIVEDSEDDALLLLRELRRGDYELTFARVDTPEAMQEALEREKWDLVISDYSMPQFSAPAALEVLQKSGRDLPFIIVSGTIGEDSAVAAMKSGAHDYLIKGKLARLLPAVERELREAQIRRERRKAQEQIEASLKEKEVLLKEIHHRVKNNLQIICSLLDLQAEYLTDPQAIEVFQNSQNRIQSMALIHEKLYQSKDLATINFADYIQELITNLWNSYEVCLDNVTLTTKIEPVVLDIDTAIPCGLIVNELVSNALKYAFPLGHSGELSIELHSIFEKECLLIISDTGIGLPKDLDFQNTKTLGLQLVNALTYQLNGSLSLSGDCGTKFELKFFKQK